MTVHVFHPKRLFNSPVMHWIHDKRTSCVTTAVGGCAHSRIIIGHIILLDILSEPTARHFARLVYFHLRKLRIRPCMMFGKWTPTPQGYALCEGIDSARANVCICLQFSHILKISNNHLPGACSIPVVSHLLELYKLYHIILITLFTFSKNVFLGPPSHVQNPRAYHLLATILVLPKSLPPRPPPLRPRPPL